MDDTVIPADQPEKAQREAAADRAQDVYRLISHVCSGIPILLSADRWREYAPDLRAEHARRLDPGETIIASYLGDVLRHHAAIYGEEPSAMPRAYPEARNYPEHTVCKSCGAPITFALSEESGKVNVMDRDPVPSGNAMYLPDGRIRFHRKAAPLPEDAERYQSHYATCPDAAAIRREIKRRNEADPSMPNW